MKGYAARVLSSQRDLTVCLSALSDLCVCAAAPDRRRLYANSEERPTIPS